MPYLREHEDDRLLIALNQSKEPAVASFAGQDVAVGSHFPLILIVMARTSAASERRSCDRALSTNALTYRTFSNIELP
jgi:hypothetical protein